MAISKEEVKKLADLARIEIDEEEAEKLSGEMDAILDYVGQVSAIAKTKADEERNMHVASPEQGEVGSVAPGKVNIMREDENPNASESFNKELINEFPDKEGDYLKVKKIL